MPNAATPVTPNPLPTLILPATQFSIIWFALRSITAISGSKSPRMIVIIVGIVLVLDILNLTGVIVNSLDKFTTCRNDDIYVFLDGGMGKYVDERKHLVTVPGDVAYGSILSKIAKQMDFVSEEETLYWKRRNNEFICESLKKLCGKKLTFQFYR